MYMNELVGAVSSVHLSGMCSEKNTGYSQLPRTSQYVNDPI